MAVTQEELAQANAAAYEARRKIDQQMEAERRKVAREIEAEFGVTALQEELLHLPEQIRRQQEAVRAAKQAVEDLRLQVDAAEANLTLEIAGAIDRTTGKPAFSNDAARKAELTRRKAADEEYARAARALQEAEAALDRVQADLDQLVNRFSSIRHLSDLQAARLRLLAG